MLTAIRVNVGGPEYNDARGNLWHGDKLYASGHWGCLDLAATDVLATRDDIVGADDSGYDSKVFQTVRCGERLRYRFDVANGT